MPRNLDIVLGSSPPYPISHQDGLILPPKYLSDLILFSITNVFRLSPLLVIGYDEFMTSSRDLLVSSLCPCQTTFPRAIVIFPRERNQHFGSSVYTVFCTRIPIFPLQSNPLRRVSVFFLQMKKLEFRTKMLIQSENLHLLP